MNDETEATKAVKGAKGKKKAEGAAGAKAKGGAKAGAGAAEGGKAKVEGQVARLLVRAIWMQDWSVANPDGKPEERKKAWTEAREGAMDRHLKAYRRALGNLTRAGVAISYEAPAKKAGGAAEDEGGED